MSDSSKPEPRAVPDYADGTQHRSLPEWRDALRLRYVLSWLGGFLENWYFSRNFLQLLAGVPFLVLVVGGAALLVWFRSVPQDALLSEYEQAVQQALQTDDLEAASVYLKSMVAHRPQDKKYRFQLALHLLRHDQKPEAGSHLRDLVRPGSEGYNPARLWLVTQATGAEPLIPLTQEAMEAQLMQILQTDPRNLLANRMLAEFNLRSGQLKAAEDRLLGLVEFVPALSLQLAKVQRLLNRSPEQVEHHLASADRYFQQELLQDPAQFELRISRSEVLLLQNKEQDAERVLKEGLAIQDVPELTDALARLYVSVAAGRLQNSGFNRESALRLMVQALQLKPASQGLLRQTLLLAASESSLASSDLAPSIDALLALDERTPEEELLLCQALATAQRVGEAISRLSELQHVSTQHQVLLAKLSLMAGQTDRGRQLLHQLSDDYQSRQEQLSNAETVDYADVLLLQEQPDTAVELLRAALVNSSGPTAKTETEARNVREDVSPIAAPQPPESEDATAGQRSVPQQSLQAAYGRACLATYDRRLQQDSWTDSDQAMEMLQAALQTGSYSLQVIDRLAALSLSDHRFSAAADAKLTRLLATAVGTADIYNLLGTRALTLQQTQKALKWLQRASSLAPDNPMVLNNLALAMVRDDPRTASQALEFITEVLKILPEHPDALSTRAEILITLERWEEARRDLEVVLPQRQTSTNSRMLIAQVYEALGEPELAREHRRILEELETR